MLGCDVDDGIHGITEQGDVNTTTIITTITITTASCDSSSLLEDFRNMMDPDHPSKK